MKFIENDGACLYYEDREDLRASIVRLCLIIRENPFVLRPFMDADKEVGAILDREGFVLYPTVEKTTLFFDPGTDCFFKIIHPLNLKNRVSYYFTDRARSVYDLSRDLNAKGVKLPEVTAFGFFRKGRRPFYAIKRIKGTSLNDILIRDRKNLTLAGYRKIVDEVARLHKLGYWLGDAHLAHIFMQDGEVTGFIDMDSMRKNRPYLLRNLAKDISGLNHPGLQLSKADKMSLLDYYCNVMAIGEEKKFLRLVKLCTVRRWEDYGP
jgi:hypothetical protein